MPSRDYPSYSIVVRRYPHLRSGFVVQLVPYILILIMKCLALFHCSVFCAANIFGIGDCTNVPTSRTAAACAAESAVIRKNLLAVMRGEVPKAHVSSWGPICASTRINCRGSQSL